MSHGRQKSLGRFAVPSIAALVLLGFASMAVLLVQIAQRQDTHAAEQARRFASSALDRRRETIAKEVKDYAAWGEAYQHLHLKTDIEWAFTQANLGPTLYTDLGYDVVLVIGPTGTVTYAVVDGKLASRPPAALSGPALDALVETARSAPAGESKPAVGYLEGQEAPMLVAATAITAGGDPTIASTDTRSILVFADALTPARLNEIGTQGFVSGLRISGATEKTNTDRSLVLPTADRSTLLAVTWRPEQPGRRLLRQMLPWLLAAALAFVALIGLVLRRMMRAAKRIETAAHALAEAHRLADHSAHHDGLTNLPNRLMLFRYLREAAEPMSDLQPIAVVYIDLDRFKPINDALGHSVGDRVLQLTADRLRSVLHKTDIAARIGGDEFVLVFARVTSLGEVKDRCRRVIDLVREPIEVEGSRLQIGLSMGVAFASAERREADELIRQADLAMYQVKAGGGNDLRVYSGDALTSPRSTTLRPDRMLPR